MAYKFSEAEISKIKKESEKDYLKQHEEKQERIKNQIEQADKWGFGKAKKIAEEGATYSNKDKANLKQSEHKHGSQTSASDNLPRGSRGGHIYGKTGEFRRVA